MCGVCVSGCVELNIFILFSAANQVKLVDSTFPSNDFAKVLGQLSVEWRSIPPNGNVTHVVVLKPLKSDFFNFTSAELSYIASEDAEPQVIYFYKRENVTSALIAMSLRIFILLDIVTKPAGNYPWKRFVCPFIVLQK